MPVIFIMVILTILAVSLSVTAHREIQASSNYANQIRRFYAARGALNYALSSLAQTSNNGATYGIVQPDATADANGWWQIGDDWVKVEVVDTASRININTVSLSTLQYLPLFQSNSDLAQAIIDWRMAQTTGTPAATGAAGSTGTPPTAPTQDNGENEYYQGLPIPYSSKSAPFDTVDELLLVKGMTPAILYGSVGGTPLTESDVEQATATAGSGNGATRHVRPTRQAAPTSGTQPSSGANGNQASGAANGAQPSPTATAADFSDIYSNSKVPLAELLTTTSRERNVAADGSARVNINTATAQDLQQKLGINASLANRLVNFRNPPNANQGGVPTGRPGPGNTQGPGGPPQAGGNPRPGGGPQPGGARSALATRQVPRPGGAPGPVPTATGGASGLPGANAGGPMNGQPGNPATNPAGSQNGASTPPVFKTLADLLAVPGFSRTVMQSIADRISVDDNPNRDWVININTAPPEVLATAPGMTRPVVDAITQYRQGGQVFQTLGDLFTVQSITLAQYQAVLSRLATKSSTYVVHIKVRSPGQQGIYAATALVEMTANGPQVLQWREVARTPGWSTWGHLPVLPTPSAATSSSAPAAGTGAAGQ